jgi:hypothetical protein
MALLRAVWVCRSHNFLNQKPWHPLNFRNQARVYEAEQQAIRDKKTREQAKVGLRADFLHIARPLYWSVLQHAMIVLFLTNC